MGADYIYEYWKTAPEFAPNKFEISGGLELREGDTVFSNYVAKLGQAIGSIYGEFEVPEQLLYDIEIDNNEQVITIGGYSSQSNMNKTASTMDVGLREMFASLNTNVHKKKSKRQFKLCKKKTRSQKFTDIGRNDGPENIYHGGDFDVTREIIMDSMPNQPGLRFSDIPDEVLQDCSQSVDIDGGLDEEYNIMTELSNVENNIMADMSTEAKNNTEPEHNITEVKHKTDAEKWDMLRDPHEDGDDYNIAAEIDGVHSPKNSRALTPHSDLEMDNIEQPTEFEILSIMNRY